MLLSRTWSDAKNAAQSCAPSSTRETTRTSFAGARCAARRLAQHLLQLRHPSAKIADGGFQALFRFHPVNLGQSHMSAAIAPAFPMAIAAT